MACDRKEIEKLRKIAKKYLVEVKKRFAKSIARRKQKELVESLEPKIVFSNMKDLVGYISLDLDKIILSTYWFKKYGPRDNRETIAHEFAHIIDFHERGYVEEENHHDWHFNTLNRRLGGDWKVVRDKPHLYK